VVQRKVRHSQEQGLAVVKVLSCREGDVSACCTQGRRAVLPLLTCATVSGTVNQSCSCCVQLSLAALVIVSVGASREGSLALVLLRQEHGAALIVLSRSACYSWEPEQPVLAYVRAIS